MTRLVKYTSEERRDAIVQVIHDMLTKIDVTKPVKIGLDAVNAFFHFLENAIGFFSDKQSRITEIREEFKTITNFLKLGRDSRSANSYNFCMRVHYIDDTTQRIIFMDMIVSAFQNSPSEAIDRFSDVGMQMVNNYFSNL